MESLEAELVAETQKWLAKVKQERLHTELIDKSKTDFMKNIDAYIADAQHFSARKDFIKAFEAVIWAWAWLEIGKQFGVLKSKQI